VKRNNGVWISRGTHVYKIVEKPSAEGKVSPNSEESRISTVQRNIKKFEKLEKPSVPLKSEQLRKHLELMRGSNLPRGPRVKRNLKLPSGSVGIPELAMVKEELKAIPAEEQAKQPKSTESLPKNNHHEELNHTDDRPSEEPDGILGEKEAEAEEEEEDQRQKQRKHKYASIYEKLRFTFAKGRKSASPSPTKGRSREEISIDEEERVTKEKAREKEVPQEEVTKKEDFKLEIPREVTPKEEDLEDPSHPLLISPCLEADAKILDALEALDQKLKVLSPLSEVTAPGGDSWLRAARAVRWWDFATATRPKQKQRG